MKHGNQSAELNTRVKGAMNEAGGNRFYIDERGGCIAVRDKLRDNPDDNGLHQDTNGVVSYWRGYKEYGEWKISQACKDNAKELRDKLNGYEGATQKPVYTQEMADVAILAINAYPAMLEASEGMKVAIDEHYPDSPEFAKAYNNLVVAIALAKGEA